MSRVGPASASAPKGIPLTYLKEKSHKQKGVQGFVAHPVSQAILNDIHYTEHPFHNSVAEWEGQ